MTDNTFIYVEYRELDLEDTWISSKILQQREIRSWCDEQFPQGGWTVGTSGAFFKNEHDATLFALRWT